MRPTIAIAVSVTVALALAAAAIFWQLESRLRRRENAVVSPELAHLSVEDPAVKLHPVTTHVTSRSSEATLVVEVCVVSLRVNGRVVYRGKPHCQNRRHELSIAVPHSAAHLEIRSADNYASGNIWGVNTSSASVRLIASRRYFVGDGYVMPED